MNTKNKVYARFTFSSGRELKLWFSIWWIVAFFGLFISQYIFNFYFGWWWILILSPTYPTLILGAIILIFIMLRR